jgi:hypothetical protein
MKEKASLMGFCGFIRFPKIGRNLSAIEEEADINKDHILII